MKNTFTYPIPPQAEPIRVEEFLRAHGYSKKLIIHLRNQEQGLTIGGERVYTTHQLVSGEILTVTIEEKESSSHIVPVPMPLHIVYEDEHILILNKEANVPVHPSQGNFDNTLANGVAHYFKEKDQPFVYRAVNRLDRDTTGLMILAKHMLSSCILSDMVVKRQIRREYLAITSGLISEKGIVSAPIARKEGSTIERCVDIQRGDPAVTHYHPLSYYPDSDCSLVKLALETGRTHQIRVHMKYIGHPLLGDFLYNPDYRNIERQSLHSWKLKFSHPITGKSMYFYAPLPDDMRFLFSKSQNRRQPTP